MIKRFLSLFAIIFGLAFGLFFKPEACSADVWDYGAQWSTSELDQLHFANLSEDFLRSLSPSVMSTDSWLAAREYLPGTMLGFLDDDNHFYDFCIFSGPYFGYVDVRMDQGSPVIYFLVGDERSHDTYCLWVDPNPAHDLVVVNQGYVPQFMDSDLFVTWGDGMGTLVFNWYDWQGPLVFDSADNLDLYSWFDVYSDAAESIFSDGLSFYGQFSDARIISALADVVPTLSLSSSEGLSFLSASGGIFLTQQYDSSIQSLCEVYWSDSQSGTYYFQGFFQGNSWYQMTGGLGTDYPYLLQDSGYYKVRFHFYISGSSYYSQYSLPISYFSSPSPPSTDLWYSDFMLLIPSISYSNGTLFTSLDLSGISVPEDYSFGPSYSWKRVDDDSDSWRSLNNDRYDLVQLGSLWSASLPYVNDGPFDVMIRVKWEVLRSSFDPDLPLPPAESFSTVSVVYIISRIDSDHSAPISLRNFLNAFVSFVSGELTWSEFVSSFRIDLFRDAWRTFIGYFDNLSDIINGFWSVLPDNISGFIWDVMIILLFFAFGKLIVRLLS